MLGADDFDFSDVVSSVESTAPSASGIVQDFKNRFNAAVASLDNAISNLSLRHDQLLSLASVAQTDAQLSAEYDAQIAANNAANSAIQTTQDAVAQVLSWWDSIKSTFGFAGAVRGLGAIITIPWALVAGIVAATASIAYLVSSSATLVDKLNYKAWVDGGRVGPAPVSVSSGGLFGDIGGAAKLVAIGFVAWLILPKLLNHGK